MGVSCGVGAGGQASRSRICGGRGPGSDTDRPLLFFPSLSRSARPEIPMIQNIRMKRIDSVTSNLTYEEYLEGGFASSQERGVGDGGPGGMSNIINDKLTKHTKNT